MRRGGLRIKVRNVGTTFLNILKYWLLNEFLQNPLNANTNAWWREEQLGASVPVREVLQVKKLPMQETDSALESLVYMGRGERSKSGYHTYRSFPGLI